MQKYNNELRVGGLAMIIGTKQVCNRHLIGRTVTVEAIVSEKAPYPTETIRPEYLNAEVFAEWVNENGETIYITSGVQTSTDDGRQTLWKDGLGGFAGKYLMPIGDDDELLGMFRKEDNPYMVTA